MSSIGIIGYGSMGAMLLRGFIETGAAAPENIIVSTRTQGKLDGMKAEWPGIQTASDNAETAATAKYIFVCVEPDDVKKILLEIKGSLNGDSVIVSAAGSVSIKNIEGVTHGKVIRFMPAVTSEVREGITLMCHNASVSSEEAGYIEALLGKISKVKKIPEEDFDPALILTSCGPGLFAAMLEEFTEAALRLNDRLSRKDAEDMVIATFYGTAKTLLEKNMSFGEMICRVATKGGTTAEGVRALRDGLPETFDRMYGAALTKWRSSGKKIDADFMN